MIQGKRIAILGAGKSGSAAFAAVQSLRGIPTLYDRALSSDPLIVGGWDKPFTLNECDLLITSPGVPQQSAVLQGTLAHGIPIWSEIELAYQIAQAPIVAITGTNGKSTATVMTWLALREAGFNSQLCGNIAGSGYPEQPLVSAALASRGTTNQILVAEVSSFQLEWIREFRPRAAAITNISPDHLDRYGGDFELYAATKHKIYANMRDADVLCLPSSFPLPPCSAKIWRFGDENTEATTDESHLQIFGESVPKSDLPFNEPHNIVNALCASLLTVAIAGQAKLPEIIRGISRFTPLDNRLEFVGEREGIRIINNTMCTNPAAVIASSNAVKGKQHLLVGGKRKLLDFEPLAVHLAATGHCVYLFGQDREEIQKQMGGSWPLFDTIEEAFRAATDSAKPGEVVMLAPGCASQDQFEDFQHRGNVFKEIAKEWLNDYALPDS